MLVLPSSSNGYVVFHALSVYSQGTAKKKEEGGKKLYRSCPAEVFSPISCLSASVAGIAGFFARRGSFAAGWGGAERIAPAMNSERRRGGEEEEGDRGRCRTLAYWQTFSNFTPIWPGAASHFALICTPSRRGVIRRYICTCTAVKPPWHRDRTPPPAEMQKAAARYSGRCARFFFRVFVSLRREPVSRDRR